MFNKLEIMFDESGWACRKEQVENIQFVEGSNFRKAFIYTRILLTEGLIKGSHGQNATMNKVILWTKGYCE